MPKLSERIKNKNETLKTNSKVEVEEKIANKAQAKLDEVRSIKARIEEKRQQDEARTRASSKLAEIRAFKNEAAVAREQLSEEEQAEATTVAQTLRTRFNNLIKRVQLTDQISATTRLGNQIEDLPEDIAAIRQRGYEFRSYLEHKIEVFAERWDDVNERIEDWLENEVEDLEDDLAAAEEIVEDIAVETFTKTHQGLFEKLASMLETLETKAEAAEEKISALYNELTREVSKTASQLREVNEFLDWRDEAAFEFNPDESVYMVAKAEWDDGGKKPDGMLYLTDQRLIFEQKETVGKKLGMFGGKQVQGILWQAPLDALEKSVPENKGMMGGKDMVHLTFGSGADYPSITVEVKGGVPAKLWATEIKRAAAGHIHQDSTVEVDPELLEKLAKAPTDCPNCGSTLPRLSEHRTEAACPYCATVVRV